MSVWSQLARLLAVRDDQIEEVVRSESSARAALSRRGLFQAAGAVAAGSLLFETPAVERFPFDGINRLNVVSFNRLNVVSFNEAMKRLYPVNVLPPSKLPTTDSYAERWRKGGELMEKFDELKYGKAPRVIL